MSVRRVGHPTVGDRVAAGKAARETAPRSSHAGWQPAPDRPDPVVLLKEQDATREPDLVPVRHGRMMVSPFTFYRGAAKIMAVDLRESPRAGLEVQLCGDAHLSNFGVYASPERTLLFDLNDFDETLPGPFEYDVKRLAASFFVAGRNNAFSDDDSTAAALMSATAYRETMSEFAQTGTLAVWYAHMPAEQVLEIIRRAAPQTKQQQALQRRGQKAAEKVLDKARTRDSLQALEKLGEMVDGEYRIVSQPPVIVPARELAARYGLDGDEVAHVVHDQLRDYRSTLDDDRRHLLEHFQVVDVARKVVGIGSVGTRAFIALLSGRDQQDPLFLQVKEATTSALEDSLPKSRYRHQGERVVQGQRMMQAASDIFLGWTKGRDASRHFYWRQLRDMKGSVEPESMQPEGLRVYARLCGWTLARAHARSGDPIAIASYLGARDRFDRAIADFARRYADQNESDYDEFVGAVRSGSIEAVEGV
jgi:uncharacterized protein (DUF2252 family)